MSVDDIAKGVCDLKFDVVIGNPPYQEDIDNNRPKLIYHLFIDEAYKIAKKAILITPARFLFKAGQTPKWVVEKMVNDLESENPGIFEDDTKTFVDLYMKSGLYITEIVKRLFNNPVMKTKYPDDAQRLRHILEKQVYGFAPSEIIYRIATNFIFGPVDDIVEQSHFVQVDTIPYAKEGRIQELVDTY